MIESLNKSLTVVSNAVITVYKVVTSKFFYIPLLTVASVFGVNYFFDNYRLRTPILVDFQIPYEARVLEMEIISPIPNEVYTEPKTDMEIIAEHKYAKVLEGMYMLESTQGKNDGCKDEGKFNGYGYRQNNYEWVCYDSFEKVTQLVEYWLEDRLAYNGGDLAEALCYYNLGVSGLESCKYSQNYLRATVMDL